MSTLNRKKWVVLLLIAVFTAASFSVLGATAVSSKSKSSSSSSFRSDRDDEKGRKGAVRDFIMAIIGGMLRHPDPIIRKQAIQTISTGMVGSDSEGRDSDEGGVRNLFGFNDEDSGDEEDMSTGVGGAVFIPDLYVLLSDPDPEVRDIASVGLDMIFQTDTTVLRFMNDPDPIIRKYAAQIYAKKRLSQNQDRGDRNEEELSEVSDLLGIRTLLVRLKNEENPEVKKTIRDTLNWYIRYGGDREDRTSERGFEGDMFGVDAVMIYEYLNDENSEIRLQAIKTIVAREQYSDDLLKILLERLRVEEDKEVKKELLKAMDTLRSSRDERQGRGLAGPAAPMP
jgi:hypothetical protein